MALPCYLALTSTEFNNAKQLPEKTAWMACHFSNYGLCLSNLPKMLPDDSMIIINDRTPICGHNPQLILEQLTTLAQTLNPAFFLLDFQRPNESETAALVKYLHNKLPCPVGVSEYYAEDLDCPVFLPPVPLHIPIQEYLAPWTNREIWLDVCLESESIILTKDGCKIDNISSVNLKSPSFYDAGLHCDYHIQLIDDGANFTLQRNTEHLENLMTEAENLGVQICVALYQQLATK